jgi:L-ascorbate metabolism protein UlaG (beta-lactamase superfamily)
MKIKYLAHASFLITSDNGTAIVNDPYSVAPNLKYKPLSESAQIVTMSHGHGDHNNVKGVKGNPRVIKEAGKAEAAGIPVRGLASYHDEVKGSKRGNNVIFCFAVDGLNVCHLGDLGHELGDKEAAEIGPVDVLMVPVGGFYTIDASEATEVVRKLKPRVVIPMHYKTELLDFPITGVEEFLKGKKNVKKPNSSEIEIKKDKLPADQEIVVLQHAN